MDLLIDWTGIALLAAIVLAVFCAIDKMTETTDNAVRWSVVFIGAGAVGQFCAGLAPYLATLWPALDAGRLAWAPYLDVPLFGGIAGLLFADRRQRLGQWARRVAVVLMWLAGAVVAISVMVLPARAQAPSPGAVRMDCQQLAKAVASAMVFRDVGADLKKLEASVRAHAGAQAGPHLEATLREIRRAWPLGQPPEETAFATYQRCTRQLGDMGREG